MDVEISVAGIALVIVTLGFALIYIQRASLSKKLDSFRVETQAHHQASYGMAKHIRYLQLQNERMTKVESETSTASHADTEEVHAHRQLKSQTRKPSAQRVDTSGMTADIVDFRSPNDAINTEGSAPSDGAGVAGSGELDSAVERLFSEGADARRLSEALGISRSEAEIIAHIGPQHRNRA